MAGTYPRAANPLQRAMARPYPGPAMSGPPGSDVEHAPEGGAFHRAPATGRAVTAPGR